MIRVASWMLVLAVIAAPGPLTAQGHGDGLFLFGYMPKPGMEAEFADGYRRHLEWHAERRDSLAWLGWTVVAGPGLGMFVDGVFGTRFRAFDERVDPQADARDAAANVTAFANPIYRHAYRLRHDLSSSARLEAGAPARMQHVVWLTVRPEGVAAFERGLEQLDGVPGLLDYSTYELVAGGERPAFLIIVQVDAWADLEDPAADPSRVLLRAHGPAVARATSEIWLYRPDLTYIPR